MVKLLWIFLGGGVGSLLRYGMGGAVQRMFNTVFPWGTLSVNLLGSFAIGFLWELFADRTVGPEVRMLIFVGLLGGFTTFSTFALETTAFLRDSQWLRACGNMAAHNGMGLVAMFLGLATGRVI